MQSGELIGDKYELVKPIGTGALGIVWEALDRASAMRVALKFLALPAQETQQRLIAEAVAARNAAYPTLCTIFDVGSTQAGVPFVVLELLSGETLADRLARERKLSPSLAAQIGRDIASALSVAHAARLTHGDIRPANIFLQGEPGSDAPATKLLDLWVARAVLAAEAQSLGLGSPSYKSPEQLISPDDFDLRSDLWSLGVVLFEMLSGQRPFEGGRSEVTALVTGGSIPRLSQVVPDMDTALEEIVARCMERERDKRIGSSMVVSHMLEVFVKPIPAAPVQSLPESGPAVVGEAYSEMPFDSAPRGQLGTLVMAETEPPSEPLLGQLQGAGPLGTLVMGPGGIKQPGPDSAPPPREPERTLIYVEPDSPPPAAKTDGLATALLPGHIPLPQPTPMRPAFATPRRDQKTSNALAVPGTSNAETPQNNAGMIVTVSIIVAIVVLLGLFVVFVLLA